MKRLLLIACLVAGMAGKSYGAYCYIVNADTVYANLTYDRQWIDLFKDDMGLTVHVITDDSAGAITSVDAYDGYFCSATMTSANLTNLRASTKGIVICDQLLYDDFLVASGQTGLVSFSSLVLDRADSNHAVTKYMFNKITFSLSGGTSFYANTGIPQGATILFDPSNKYWDASTDPDTAFCYAIDTGDSLVGAVAAGRRVVALSHYGLLTQSTDMGWCHPYELMGNLVGWAWGIEDNVYNANYNCYSTDIATDPGPEINQAWAEYGVNWRYIYYNGRTGYDSRIGLMFLQSRFWNKKAMPETEVDSFKLSYKINYQGFGSDAPPTLTDTITLGTIISATRLLFDTTTLSRSMYDLHYPGSSKAFVIRSGIGADTIQMGDTITFTGGSRNGTNDTLYYARTAAGFFNGTSGTNVRLAIGDPYGGFDFWLKMYAITPTTIWTAPLVSEGGGNPEGHATRTWVNRTNIRNGATGAVAWNAVDLTPGVDHSQAAIDSFRVNRTTFAPDGSGLMEFVIPGSYFNSDTFNWVVFKSIDSSGGGDSTDIEIIPQSIANVRGSYVQRFEMFLSTASPLVIGFDDSVLTITAEVDEVVDPLTNYIRNTGDGVLSIESVTDNKSWMVQTTGGGGGNTPLLVSHALNTAGPARVDTATVTVTASTASNSPLTYLVIMTLTEPAVEVPPGAVPKRTGLRLQ